MGGGIHPIHPPIIYYANFSASLCKHANPVDVSITIPEKIQHPVIL